MKGIVKYQNRFYKKIKPTPNNIKKGDLIKLECTKKSFNDNMQFNGIYTVVNDYREIHIENYDGEGSTLCLKLGYNVGYNDFSILRLSERNKKSLPSPAKEEMINGFNI